MTLTLADDGTLDTVIHCTECGRDERYNYYGEGDPESYDDFVLWALHDAEELHYACERRVVAESIGEYVYDAIESHLSAYQGGPGMLAPTTELEVYQAARKAFSAAIESLEGEDGNVAVG